MANLLKRLRKLEQQIAGNGGLVPGSPQWLEYWSERIDKIISGEDLGTPGCIPLEAVDAVLRAARSAAA
jgi:hypothetical protein